MTIEKPTINRKELLAEEARRARATTRLLRMTELLAPNEQLGGPVRVEGGIMVPIVRHRRPIPRYRDAVREIARRWLQGEQLN